MSSHRRLRSRQRTRARIAHLDCNSVPDVISFQLFLRYGSVMVWSAFWRVAVVRWDQTLAVRPNLQARGGDIKYAVLRRRDFLLGPGY